MESITTDQKESGTYPDILIKIYGALYSISSRHVTSIMQLPKYNKVPEAPEGILGIIPFRGRTVPLLDMRSVFGMLTLNEEYQEFVSMLEARKQDHIHWVNVLEDSIREDKRFPLATDPHKCAFGRWYDSYESDNSEINFHLRKIDEPHKKLHRAAIDVEGCSKDHEHCNRNQCVKDIFAQVKGEYMPTILRLLEEAKEIFKSAFTEMVLVLESESGHIAIVVDGVLSVEEMALYDSGPEFQSFNHSPYISGVKKSRSTDELILQLDDDKLIGYGEQVSLEA